MDIYFSVRYNRKNVQQSYNPHWVAVINKNCKYVFYLVLKIKLNVKRSYFTQGMYKRKLRLLKMFTILSVQFLPASLPTVKSIRFENRELMYDYKNKSQLYFNRHSNLENMNKINWINDLYYPIQWREAVPIYWSVIQKILKARQHFVQLNKYLV